MPYIFYDNNNSTTVGSERSTRYTVDGKTVLDNPDLLPAGWEELEVVYAPYPDRTETQIYVSSWAKNGSLWEQTRTVREMSADELENLRIGSVPEKITKAQFFKAMWVVLGKERNEVVTIINNLADTAAKRMRLIELQDEPYIRRDSDFVAFIQNHFGYTDLQIDNFFTTAGSL